MERRGRSNFTVPTIGKTDAKISSPLALFVFLSFSLSPSLSLAGLKKRELAQAYGTTDRKRERKTSILEWIGSCFGASVQIQFQTFISIELVRIPFQTSRVLHGYSRTYINIKMYALLVLYDISHKRSPHISSK